MAMDKEPQDVVDERFGILLRKWRRDRKLTIEEAARRMKMTELRLCSLEVGKPTPSVKFKEVQAIARIYGVELAIVYNMAIGVGYSP